MLLKDFLKSKKVISKYRKNAIREKDYQFSQHVVEDYNMKEDAIMKAFDWNETPEGKAFWFKIDLAWRRTLREYNEKTNN